MNSGTKRKWDYHTLVMVQVLVVFLGTPFGAFTDGSWLASYCSFGQEITNGTVICVYCWMFWVAKKKLHWLMLIMTISGVIAEITGSYIFVLYEYRLHNIPLYIPLGHAVMYACVYHLANNPLIWRFHKVVERYLEKFAFLTAVLSLFVLNDQAGFLCYFLFLFILYTRQKKLFYLLMFAWVYVTELFGTVFSTWAWYGVLNNHPNFPHIGYTPSSAAGLYFLIDLGSNCVYYYLLKISPSKHMFFHMQSNTKTITIT